MSSTESYINADDIRDMLYGDETYIKEFARAGIASFTEFSSHYKKYLLARDETNFRKAGHKIKPVALMLKVNEIVEEYEHAKTLLHQDASDKKLESSIDKIQGITKEVIAELSVLT